MSKNKLFADAVTDAKTLKETALANAKLAIEESLAPKVQSMISNQLNEMEEEEDGKSLEEILNEMEGEEVPENPEDYTQQPGYIHEDEELEGGEEGEEEVAELTVDELKDVIRDVMAELGAGEEEPEMEPEMEPEFEEEEEDIDLDEILNEMGTASIDPSHAAAAVADELLSMIKSAVSKAPELARKIQATLEDLGSAAGSAMRSEAKELEEAKKIISNKTKQLSEVNLLNSKLLNLNRIFKANNLTESQKVKAVNAFDRATTVKEVENTYQTLKESLVNSSRTQIKENKGFASKPLGEAKKELIVEGNDFVARMQKLAGIK